jgi:hypothetical protein
MFCDGVLCHAPILLLLPPCQRASHSECVSYCVFGALLYESQLYNDLLYLVNGMTVRALEQERSIKELYVSLDN